MKLFYVIPIVIGFGIDLIDLGKWIIAFFKKDDLPNPSFDAVTVFVLPAWGISGFMIFGKEPEEILNIWNIFLLILLISFCMHLFIRIAIPFIIVIIYNLYYGKGCLDLRSLTALRKEPPDGRSQ